MQITESTHRGVSPKGFTAVHRRCVSFTTLCAVRIRRKICACTHVPTASALLGMRTPSGAPSRHHLSRPYRVPSILTLSADPPHPPTEASTGLGREQLALPGAVELGVGRPRDGRGGCAEALPLDAREERVRAHLVGAARAAAQSRVRVESLWKANSHATVCLMLELPAVAFSNWTSVHIHAAYPRMHVYCTHPHAGALGGKPTRSFSTRSRASGGKSEGQ